MNEANGVRKYIAYYRVSTAKQGASGLGLEAQQSTVKNYIQSSNGSLIRSYKEVESGKRADRPQLDHALADAKRTGAALIIAKLDRLSRNVPFLRKLTDSGADILFCDLPQVPPGAVGRFILTNMAAAAELEAGLASERTKAGLAAARARGVKLGSHRPGAARLEGGANPRAARRAGEVSRAAAEARCIGLAEVIGDVIRSLRAEGRRVTHSAIARELTRRGHVYRQGKGAARPWNHVQVRRVLARVGGSIEPDLAAGL